MVLNRVSKAILVLAILAAGSATTSHANAAPAPASAKLFAVGLTEFLPPGTLGPVYRFDVPAGGAASLETQFTHASHDAPYGLTFSSAGELFIVNRSWQFNTPKLTRFLDPLGTPTFNGIITDPAFARPHAAVFRGTELFVANPFSTTNRRFLFDATGAPVPNGGWTHPDNYIRDICVSPWGEFFTTEYATNLVLRWTLVGGAMVNTGSFGGNGLSSPHSLAFSPWGELFVANTTTTSLSRFAFDAAHNVIPNGSMDTTRQNIGLTFSAWGELFVTSHNQVNIQRFVFSPTFVPSPNGGIATAIPIAEVDFFRSAPAPSLGPDATVFLGQTYAGAVTITDADSTSWNVQLDFGDASGQVFDTTSIAAGIAHLYSSAGTYTMTAAVFDEGWFTGSDSLSVRVVTPQSLVLILKTGVATLVSDGKLAARYAAVLTPLLDRAQARLDAGQPAMAVAQLRSFVSYLTRYVAAGYVPAADAQPLLNDANLLIAYLS